MTNPTKAALRAGRSLLGCLVTMPSIGIVQALAASGLDFVMIDMEHAPVGIEMAAAMIAATKGSQAAPLVRVPGAVSSVVKQVLDSGAFGVVFPQIATAEEARAAVMASRYPPQGSRGYGPAHAALRWNLTPAQYVAAANAEVIIVALIESAAAVAALDDILAVEGLDVVAVARSDLSTDLGLPGQFDHPRLKQIVATAEAKIRGHSDVALGGIAFSPEEARAMIEAGYRFLVLGTDVGLVQRTVATQLSAIRG